MLIPSISLKGRRVQFFRIWIKKTQQCCNKMLRDGNVTQTDRCMSYITCRSILECVSVVYNIVPTYSHPATGTGCVFYENVLSHFMIWNIFVFQIKKQYLCKLFSYILKNNLIVNKDVLIDANLAPRLSHPWCPSKYAGQDIPINS